jgi:hypothetical protein
LGGAGNPVNPNATVTQGYLRLEQRVAQQNVIRWPVLTTADVSTNTERRLNQSDRFLVTHFGFQLYYLDPEAATNADRAQARLRSYPAFDVSTGTNDIYALYNGSFSLRVNETVYFDRFDALQFLRADSAQEGLNVTPTVVGENNQYAFDTWQNSNWSYAFLTPFILLGGRDSINLELNLGANIDLADNDVWAVTQMRGMLIQNAYKD